MDRRQNIEKAHRLIFEGTNVTSKYIEDILGENSLVPTWVRAFHDPNNASHLILK